MAGRLAGRLARRAAGICGEDVPRAAQSPRARVPPPRAGLGAWRIAWPTDQSNPRPGPYNRARPTCGVQSAIAEPGFSVCQRRYSRARLLQCCSVPKHLGKPRPRQAPSSAPSPWRHPHRCLASHRPPVPSPVPPSPPSLPPLPPPIPSPPLPPSSSAAGASPPPASPVSPAPSATGSLAGAGPAWAVRAAGGGRRRPAFLVRVRAAHAHAHQCGHLQPPAGVGAMHG